MQRWRKGGRGGGRGSGRLRRGAGTHHAGDKHRLDKLQVLPVAAARLHRFLQLRAAGPPPPPAAAAFRLQSHHTQHSRSQIRSAYCWAAAALRPCRALPAATASVPVTSFLWPSKAETTQRSSYKPAGLIESAEVTIVD